MRKHCCLILILTAWWMTVALVATEQTLAMSRNLSNPACWQEILPLQLAGWLIWVPSSVLLIELVSRFPLTQPIKTTSFAILCIGVGITIGAKGLVVAVLSTVTDFWYPQQVPFANIMLDSLRYNFMLAWLIVAGAHAFYFYDRTKIAQLELSEMESMLHQVKLQAVSERLNPHFLFNTLNAISELVHENPLGAEKMILGLSSLLRRSVDVTAPQTISLQEELHFLDIYIDIQKVRLGPRLQVRKEIEAETQGYLVPLLILQPIIENAIEHGIAAQKMDGLILITAKIRDDKLTLTIESPLGDGAPRQGLGIGLSVTKARLQVQYGAQQFLEVIPKQGGRIQVTVSITCAALKAASASATKKIIPERAIKNTQLGLSNG
jgi:hypothetical protein